MQKKGKIAIFISSYKSMKTLANVIDRIPKPVKSAVSEIFVIDDDSPDKSYSNAVQYKSSAKIANLTIMRNPKNMGFGGNQKEAFKYAIRKGYALVIVLHGDAQYAPEELPLFIEAYKKTNPDLVYGSRMRGDPLAGGMPIWRFLGNRFLTFMQNLVLGLNLSEYHSGYRAYKCSALSSINFAKLSSDYHFDPEMLVLFKLNKFKITEVPISTHYGPESHSPSPAATFKYFLFTMKSLADYLLHVWGIRGLEKYQKSGVSK